jgi:hypothetical protein
MEGVSSVWFAAAVGLHGVLLLAARRPDAAAPRAPRLLIASACALGLVASLNFVVNPFGSYATHLFEPMVLHSRADKLRLLEAAPAPDVVILGSSASFALAPAQISRRTGLSAFNASVHGGTPRDYHALLRHLEERGAWPRAVLIALSFEQLRPTARVGFEPGDPLTRYVAQERPPALAAAAASLLAADQTDASFRRLRASVEGNVPPPAYRFAADGLGFFTRPPSLALTERRGGNPELTFPEIDDRQWRHLQAVLEACRARGTRVVAFLPPLHPELARLWEETTSLAPIVAELQRRLAAYVPRPVRAVHDFRRLESYGGRPELFLDMRHPDAESNRLMLDVMLRDLEPAAAPAP